MSQLSRPSTIVLAALLVAGITWITLASGGAGQAGAGGDPQRLAVVWTSGDPDVAHRMTLMYAHHARAQGWFDEVRLVVWGPSQRLLVGDKDIQAEIASMREAGVHVQACVVCANSYGIAEQLRALGIEVKAMGGPLSDYIKSDWHVITF